MAINLRKSGPAATPNSRMLRSYKRTVQNEPSFKYYQAYICSYLHTFPYKLIVI